MSCKTIKELLSVYIDGELDRVDILRVEEHIEKCENCANILESYKSISINVKSIEIPKPSEKVLRNIMLFPRRKIYRLRRLAVGTCFLLILGTFLIPLIKTEEKNITQESPKGYYVLKEEQTPYTEVHYEREGNFVLTSYSGGSF
jgi:predicted anti-sigma-YlaC factor YlaD